jgi:hypothetical protein
MKDQPMPVDLDAMWKKLGVEPDGKTVRLSEEAPMAAIRRSITEPMVGKAAGAGQPSAAASPSAVFAGRALDRKSR